MNRFVDYVRGLVADANLTGAPRHRSQAMHSPRPHQSLDYPTYLRRGLVISGLGTGCALREPTAPGRPAVPRH